jgi:hypothetical protein
MRCCLGHARRLQSKVTLFGNWKFDHHNALSNCCYERFHAWIFFRTVGDLAGIEINFPGMEWTDDRSAGDDAVGQRTAAMRALVFDGEESIAEIEDRDVVAGYLYGTAFPQRNVFRLRDAEQLFRLRVGVCHWYTFSIGSI